MSQQPASIDVLSPADIAHRVEAVSVQRATLPIVSVSAST
jgi:hypothetical protein